MSANPIYIVSTRKMDESLKERASKRGFFIEDIDCLRFSYVDDPATATQLRDNIFPLVFTSQHAVKGSVFLQEKFNFILKNKTCYCIEGATSKAAQEAGFEVKGTAKNAVDLAEKIIENSELACFHCTTNYRRHDLSQALEKATIKVIACEVYDKKMRSEKVSAFDGVLFFSPSCFDAFTAANKLPADTPIFCIGKTTAQHAANFKHQNIIIAEQASEAAVWHSVFTYFKK